VFVKVEVGVLVEVLVFVGILVAVDVFVGAFVGVMVAVEVFVAVFVGVLVAVEVFVGVLVGVFVGVIVDVLVDVGVVVGVEVGEATVSENVPLAEVFPVSVAFTFNETTPISPEDGVPVNVCVDGSKDNQLGKAVSSDFVAV